MDTAYTLGIDFGGTASKATLLNRNGQVLATSSKEYPFYCPHRGWVEQDIDELFAAFIFNCKTCLEISRIDPSSISAIALDAATHMAVFCDSDDKPIRRFIHWSDSRSTEQAQFIRDNYSPVLKAHTVNSVSAAWTLPQILWLQQNEPGVLEQTSRIYFAKDYLRHRITGDFLTDSIEAMGAMLADDTTGEWCQDLCDLVNVRISALPAIGKPTDIAGYVSPEVSRLTGLKAGTPVIIGTTDTAMEVYASGAVEEGCATIKLATAGRICPITSSPIPSHQFFNYRHVIPGKWYPGTGTRSCASSYKWYRDVFGTAESEKAVSLNTSTYEVLNRAAEEVPPGSDGLFFHPFLQGEMTPYYDDSLCSSFTGIRMNHTKGHFTRAVMEGISYSMRDCLNEIRAQNIPIHQFRLIGGGAKGALWRQILCDVIGYPLTCTMENDSSLGSAMLAGVATGVFDSFQDSVEKCVKVSSQVIPNEENAAIYEKKFLQYKDTVLALAEVYHRYQSN